MPLANFFDRAALAASQALGGLDIAALRETLEREVVALVFDMPAA